MSRPSLLVLNQYYWPGVEATGQLLAELCEGLVDSLDVTVITGAIAGSGPGEDERNGVRIIRVASTSYERRQLARRALNYGTYTTLASLQALRLPRPDVVFCMTDPPFLGTAALGIAKRFRVPLVVASQDVFPEVAVELRRLDNPALLAALRALVGVYLRRADRIVAIGDTMRGRLEAKGARPERIRVIPNWVDAQRITPQPQDNDWTREQGLQAKFVVMHSGNVGFAQDLDSLVRAGTFLRDLDDLHIVIIGSGARSLELAELAQRLQVDNVTFLPYQPREDLSDALSAATLHFVGLARGLAGYVVPSRLYGIFAAGRPVVVAADASSETAEVVSRIGAGVTIPPGRPEELARVLREAHDQKLDLDGMGARGRAYVIDEADRIVAIARYRSVLSEVVSLGSDRV